MLKPGDVAIMSGARTPFGRYCGKLKDFTAQELGAIAARGAIERSGIDAKEFVLILRVQIDDVGDVPGLSRHLFGCACDLVMDLLHRRNVALETGPDCNCHRHGVIGLLKMDSTPRH